MLFCNQHKGGEMEGEIIEALAIVKELPKAKCYKCKGELVSLEDIGWYGYDEIGDCGVYACVDCAKAKNLKPLKNEIIKKISYTLNSDPWCIFCQQNEISIKNIGSVIIGGCTSKTVQFMCDKCDPRDDPFGRVGVHDSATLIYFIRKKLGD